MLGFSAPISPPAQVQTRQCAVISSGTDCAYSQVNYQSLANLLSSMDMLPVHLNCPDATLWRSGVYLAQTSEWVMACIDNLIRFAAPSFRISFDTCDLTVRTSIPSGSAISLFDRPAT